MSFKLYATNNGPVIIEEDKIIVFSDDDSLIEMCEKDDSILVAMESHVISELSSATQEFLGAATSGLNVSPSKIYSYISAFQQFWMFKNHRWPQYLMALEELVAEDEFIAEVEANADQQ